MLTITTTIGRSSSTDVASSWLRHLEAAVAVDADDGRLGPRRLRADRGGHAVAHRPEAARGDERPRAVAEQVLHRPHLVLADAGRPDDVVAAGRELLQRLEHELRLEQVAVLRGSAAGTPRARRRAGAAMARYADAWPGTVECAQLVREVGEHLLQGADHRDVRLAELPDLGRVDVEVDDRRARRERRELAGDAVVEARADGDEQVALVHRPVRPLRARACRASRSGARASPGTRSSPSASSRPGAAPTSASVEQLVAGVRVERAAADVEHRPLGRRERLRRRARSGAGARAAAASSRAGRRSSGYSKSSSASWTSRGTSTSTGPAAAGARDVERGLQHVRELLDVLHEPRVLDDRDRDAR